jgi:simple sugar transport system permease protein
VVTERAGLVNIALEGTLLAGALGGAVGGLATGSPAGGVALGLALGAAAGAAHGLLVVRARVDAIVSGVALNIAAYGATRVAIRLLYDSASNSPAAPALSGLEGHGPLARVLTDPVVIALAAAAAVLPWLLASTRWGLRLRAAGDGPAAAEAVGVDVGATRVRASVVAGALAGLGGVYLAFDQHRFSAGMSNGRGFIALAALLLGQHRPWRTAAACLGFAALEAAQIGVQDRAHVAPELVQMLPYLATLALLAVLGQRARWGGSGTSTGP